MRVCEKERQRKKSNNTFPNKLDDVPIAIKLIMKHHQIQNTCTIQKKHSIKQTQIHPPDWNLRLTCLWHYHLQNHCRNMNIYRNILTFPLVRTESKENYSCKREILTYWSFSFHQLHAPKNVYFRHFMPVNRSSPSFISKPIFMYSISSESFDSWKQVLENEFRFDMSIE